MSVFLADKAVTRAVELAEACQEDPSLQPEVFSFLSFFFFFFISLFLYFFISLFFILFFSLSFKLLLLFRPKFQFGVKETVSYFL